jgi:hypothetical protein
MNKIEKILVAGLVIVAIVSLCFSGYLYAETRTLNDRLDTNDERWTLQISFDEEIMNLWESQNELNQQFLDLFELII